VNEISKLAAYLLSPLTLALFVCLLAWLCLALRRRGWAIALASIGFVGLWVGSLPVVAQALAGKLESHYPVLAAHQAPAADAILVLGGAVVGRHPPKRPSLGLTSASTRVWYTAELYRAGKAKWIVVAAGGMPDDQGQEIEAYAIAEMLVVLGVPRTSIQLEAQSRTTRGNAANARVILERLGVRRVLLVTSAQHMPRAMQTFVKVWANSGIQLVPAPTDVSAVETKYSPVMWIPSPSALLHVTKSLKEFAGMAVLAII
jgi:uncharacterized SAM-binding protein YcdF (DUF218 family)